ncbi:MAG: acyl--CoA ligase [Anaerolineales bacterium]|nr:acyl--CoA ligase [Anaerolineales bacterium]
MSLPAFPNFPRDGIGLSLYTILANHVRQQPDKVYLYSADGRMTTRQMHDAALRLGKALEERLDSNRIVAISLNSGTAVLQLVWACLSSGICLAFLPTISDPEQVAALQSQIGAELLITDLPELQALPGALSFAALQQAAEQEDDGDWDTAVSPQTPAFLFQTSGTTGAAKWIQVTHGQYAAAIESMQDVGCLDHAIEQTVFITPPLSHSYGLSSLLEYSAMGAAVVLPAAGSTMGAVGDLLQERFNGVITALEGVPHFYAQLARLARRVNLPNLRHIGFGGGALDQEAVRQIQAVHSDLSYSVRYGLTETPSVVSHKRFAPPYADNWQSSGQVLPIYTLRLVDEAGNCVPAGQPGEIQLQGESLAWPYWGETAVADFFPTGDIGYIDPTTEELFINGRQSAFLKVRGYRLSPEYLESVIGSCAGVVDCRVSGSKTGILAEVVPADASVSSQTLLAALAAKLPNYALPEAITFVDAIPRTHSGKIKRY